jgi:hypothetical protein
LSSARPEVLEGAARRARNDDNITLSSDTPRPAHIGTSAAARGSWHRCFFDDEVIGSTISLFAGRYRIRLGEA